MNALWAINLVCLNVSDLISPVHSSQGTTYMAPADDVSVKLGWSINLSKTSTLLFLTRHYVPSWWQKLATSRNSVHPLGLKNTLEVSEGRSIYPAK